jgi:hypothetical protein
MKTWLSQRKRLRFILKDCQRARDDDRPRHRIDAWLIRRGRERGLDAARQRLVEGTAGLPYAA